MRHSINVILTLLAVGLCASVSLGAVVPFTETFAAGNGNWSSNANAPLSWSSTGGAEGAFASGTFNYSSANVDDDIPMIRASQSLGASGGAFTGDWLADDVTGFSAYVRHDAAVPLTFFVRFASPFNFPGAVAINFAPVLPNQWTLINVPIDTANPQFVTFEGSSFNDVFDGIGNLQIGARTPEALAGTDTTVTFAVDSVSIVPEPAVLTLLGAGGLVGLISRRKRTASR